jgi:hypothetical protein
MEVALEAGADDVITDDDGAIEVLTAPADFEAVKQRAGSCRPEARDGRSHHARREHHRAGRRRRRPHAETAGRAGRPGRRAGRLPQRERRIKQFMKVLVIGGGGREHALAWKLAQSPAVQAVYVAPGNGGTALDAGWRTCRSPTWCSCANGRRPEDRADGGRPRGAAGGRRGRRVPRARPAHLRPDQGGGAAGKLEGVLQGLHARHGIPTAEYETFSDPAAAHAYVDRKGAPIVVKADGLAAGKGVVVAMTPTRRTKPSTSCWSTTSWAWRTTRAARAW